jgi:hypothetical protein
MFTILVEAGGRGGEEAEVKSLIFHYFVVVVVVVVGDQRATKRAGIHCDDAGSEIDQAHRANSFQGNQNTKQSLYTPSKLEHCNNPPPAACRFKR